MPAEPNPALGLRGVRTSLWRPDLLRVQLRAILRVQPAGQCRVLLPMITDTAEIRAVRRMIDEVRRELRHTGSISVGAMIETPAAALLAERVATKSSSSRSAPTISRSTPWQWIAATPSWHIASTACTRQSASHRNDRRSG
jgi:phosphoenolpyruvate synthase/pyruvate phosphate dikinase